MSPILDKMKRLNEVKQTIDRIDDLMSQALDLTYVIEDIMMDLRYESTLMERKEIENGRWMV